MKNKNLTSLFNLFKPKLTPKPILTDIHAHLIPGIDDGPKTMDQALKLIEGMVKLGYKHICTTPHVYSDFYPNEKQTILARFDELESAIKKANLQIKLSCGAEYFLDEHFLELLEKRELLPLSNKYLLVEDSFLKRYQNIESYIFKIRTAGYTPILAHPERYLYLADDLDRLRKLKKMGCLFQLNLLSIQGHYGREVKHFALKLLKHKLIEFSGTDIHRIEHIKILETLKKNSKIFNRFHQYHFHNDALLSPSQQVVNSL